MTQDRPFTVAIVGRPNVGKSTLFNRLIGKQIAIVDDTPGVTRDRREGQGRLGPLNFLVVDTAGFEDSYDDSLEARMRQQTERAIMEADVALMVIDARAGLTPMDEAFARLLRKGSTPVILLANKCEGKAGEPGLLEAYSLGLGDPVPFSAQHGIGLSELYDALEARAPQHAFDTYEDEEPEEDLPPPDEEAEVPDGDLLPDEPPRTLQMAIVGRPNAGKSTLVNQLLGEERMLTGPEAGITRDAIAIEWEYDGRPVRLVDTAGMRRKARIDKKLEQMSVQDTLRAIRYAHVVVLMLDAELGMDKQDLTIARMVEEEGRALVIAFNKWDAVADKDAALAGLNDRLETSLNQVKGVPVVTLSALKGRNLDRLMKAVFTVYETWNRRVPTGALNRWLGALTETHAPPLVRGRRLKLRYMTQIKTRPPTFAIWASVPEELPGSYMRYLVNSLRQDFDLPAVPVRVYLRKGRNPYADKG
ncbi:ribosome biogenesis GTPase Der [Oceanibaculum pacificum]|uniref:GTPase Der n=1 Tax=Oceanibaculum pacificum TaxID=580166 RepID=A0A154WEJ4_9PROT|nr:ribosome biogenesis GTPase Der [Oceanibaculum pacificum]KZD11954.1 ribosome biogenesis GTPase Der [Oceanibaculum pacificum]